MVYLIEEITSMGSVSKHAQTGPEKKVEAEKNLHHLQKEAP
jgi:hypothetical protein